MSVVSVHRKFIGDLQESATGGITQQIVYQVICSANSDDEVTARLAVDPMGSNPMNGTRNVPAMYSAHPTIGISVIQKRVQREGIGRSFLVYVDYGTPPLIGFETYPGGTDVRWNKRVRRQTQSETSGVNKARDGVNILNSFGDIYPADIPKPYADSVYVVSFNLDTLATFGPACETTVKRVNDASVVMNIDGFSKTFPAGTLFCEDATWEWQKQADGSIQRYGEIILIYRHQLASDGTTEIGWKTHLVDRGYHYFDADTNVVSSPSLVNLDGSGGLLAPGADEEYIDEDVLDSATFTGTGKLLYHL